MRIWCLCLPRILAHQAKVGLAVGPACGIQESVTPISSPTGNAGIGCKVEIMLRAKSTLHRSIILFLVYASSAYSTC